MTHNQDRWQGWSTGHGWLRSALLIWSCYTYLEREVTSILADREKNKTIKVAAEISQDSKDPIALVATSYIQKKRFQQRGKFN